jgi:GR25 family glycosyltransferase involved in LPS biosynthesis
MSSTTAFVINLDRDKEKYSLFQKNFKASNITIERFSAVDGKEYRKKQPQDLSFYARNFSTNKNIGCFKSHILCWQEIVNRNLSHAIIFEDDIIPANENEWDTKIQSTIDKMSDISWDVLLLGFHSQYTTNDADKNAFLFFYLQMLNIATKSKKVKDGIIAPVTFLGTHAYLVSNSGARKLLNELQIVGKRPVDLEMASLYVHGKLKLFACSTPIINTYGAGGDHYMTWVLSDSVVSVMNYEIKNYHLVLFVLVIFVLFAISRHKMLIYLFLLYIVFILFLLYP